jgi:hypothetical protein
MKKILMISAVLISIAAIVVVATNWKQGSWKPKDGFVPDEKTAIAIAVAVWTPIYGEKEINGERPYIARLEGDVWRVDSSLPEGFLGGVATAIISKEDGQVRAVWHTQ